MPVQKCGKSGWQWGQSGKCFTGPGAREKALKQGRAIEANKDRTKSRMGQLLAAIKEVIDKKE